MSNNMRQWLSQHRPPRLASSPRTFALGVMGLAVGLLVVIQMRSYDSVAALVARDPETTTREIFQQIYILKLANQRLENDILTLEAQLEQYSDQTSAYDTLVAEIEKNEALLGLKPIQGPAIVLAVDTPLTVEWMIDLTNELWAAGAEAVSVNNVRLIDSTDGFYAINDLLLLHGQVLERPYTWAAIGDVTTMQTVLNQAGGILARLEEQLGAEVLTVTEAEVEMSALTQSEEESS